MKTKSCCLLPLSRATKRYVTKFIVMISFQLNLHRFTMTHKTVTILIILVIMISLCSTDKIDNDNSNGAQKVLSRKKRFMIFPTGASFSVAVCMTVGVYGNPQFSLFSWALNYGFAYNLPTNATEFLHPPQKLLDFPFFDPSLSESDENEEPETTTTTTTPKPDSTEHITALSSPSASLRRNFYYRPTYETKPMIQRRNRRDIFRNVEAVIDK